MPGSEGQRGSLEDNVAARINVSATPGPILQFVPEGKILEFREQDDPEFINIGKPDDIIP